MRNLFTIDAGQIEALTFNINDPNGVIKKFTAEAKLLLYYEQPEKTEYNFKIHVDYN